MEIEKDSTSVTNPGEMSLQASYSKSVSRYESKHPYAQIYNQIQKQREAKVYARAENQTNWKLILASQKKEYISQP